MRYERINGAINCFELNDFPPFQEQKIGVIYQCDDNFYRFQPEPEILLNCGALNRIAFELSRLNEGVSNDA